MALRLNENLQDTLESFADYFSTPHSEVGAESYAVKKKYSLGALFTAGELATALKMCCRKSAPGPYGMTNQMLENVPDGRLEELLNAFNIICTTGTIPKTWRTAWVVPIHKPGKPKTASSSYRPISLTSCVAKLKEQIIHFRVSWWLEKYQLLPKEMTGFRRGLSTADSVIDLLSAVGHNHYNKN